MKKFLLFFFFLSLVTLSQTLVPISELRMNDAAGVPIGYQQVYTIEGIVTTANNFGGAGPGSIQDITAGISVYGAAFAAEVNVGDSVTVTGKLTHFNGLTQIDFNLGGASVVVHSTGHHIDPQVINISDVLNQEWNGYEEYESRLIRINNITITGSGNFSAGTNYNITDGTGTMQIRTDESVNIIGTPIPSGTFDIIGVLGQYKNSSPYNSGYQLMPRSVLDIVDDGSPVILSPVVASNITINSFTVYYHTARNGNSQVKYGKTPLLEMDSVIVNDDTTFHTVTVTGLDPAQVYYFKALSSNEQGTSESDLKNASTASDDPNVGKINVYFNFSVDPSVSLPGNGAKGNTNFTEKLLDRINAANHSIDMALYSFSSMPDIAEALVLAKNRGVRIRVVYDNRTTQNSMQTLINAGIPVLKRTAFGGIMHNKFFVFDARDTVATNDWIWTGSWNITSTELLWKNNIVEINDPAVTRAYLTEFEEMWGSSDDQFNSSAAKFGFNKTDNTAHSFIVGGKEVQVYFSPSDGTTQKILSQIQAADKSIYFAQYAFTRNDLATGIQNRFNSGVNDIKGLIDQENTTGSQYNFLTSFAEMWQATSPTQHHKYAIIDASYPDKAPVVITGSHNWSNSAEQDNDENTLVIYDELIANQYMQEFKKRYNEAGGVSDIYLPVELTAFSASFFQSGIVLNWTTATEVNNYGFEIQRSLNGVDFTRIGFVEGNGTISQSRAYSYTDILENNQIKIFYRLKQIDLDGSSEYSNIIEVSGHKSLSYNIMQNYPNPFNPSTNITFEIPAEIHTRLVIFDITGQIVTTLIDEIKPAGVYNLKFDASDLSSGVYFYKFSAGGFTSVKKMNLLK